MTKIRSIFTVWCIMISCVALSQRNDFFKLKGAFGNWQLTTSEVLDSLSKLPLDSNLEIHLNMDRSSFFVQKNLLPVLNWYSNKTFVCAELKKIDDHRNIYVLFEKNDSLGIQPFLIIRDVLEGRMEMIFIHEPNELDVFFVNNGQLNVKIINRKSNKGSVVAPLKNSRDYNLNTLDLNTIKALSNGGEVLEYKTSYGMMNVYEPL